MLTITEKAVAAAKDYLKKENKRESRLRISAQQGCCSIQYSLSLAEKADVGDTVIEQDGVIFYVDPESGSILEEAKIDYMVSDQGEGFFINNPNEPINEGHSCGCGNGGGSCGCRQI